MIKSDKRPRHNKSYKMSTKLLNRLMVNHRGVFATQSNIFRNAASSNFTETAIGKEALYGARCHNPESIEAFEYFDIFVGNFLTSVIDSGCIVSRQGCSRVGRRGQEVL